MWSFGCGLIDEDDLDIHVNNPGSVAGLEFVLKLLDEYKVFPNDTDYLNDYSNAIENFKAGNATIIFNGSLATDDI